MVGRQHIRLATSSKHQILITLLVLQSLLGQSGVLAQEFLKQNFTIDVPRFHFQQHHATHTAIPTSWLSPKQSLDLQPLGHVLDIEVNQCNQILSGAFLSPTSCSLPTYCKEIYYTVLQNSWFWGTQSALCRGIPSMVTMLNITEQSGGFADEEAYLYGPGWKEVYYVHSPDGSYPIVSGLILLRDVNSDTWQAGSQAYILYKWKYTENRNEYIAPPQSQSDNRWCEPRLLNDDRITYMSPPHATALDAIRSIDHPFITINTTYCATETVPFKSVKTAISMSAYAEWKVIKEGHCSYAQFTWVNRTATNYLVCDPYRQTSSVLPFSLGSISGTITHILESVLQWCISVISSLITYLINSIGYFNTYFYLGEYIVIWIASCIYFRNLYVGTLPLIIIYSLLGFTRMTSDPRLVTYREFPLASRDPTYLDIRQRLW